MMMFFVSLLILIPLSFYSNYWVLMLSFLILCFLFLMKLSFSHLFCYLSYSLGMDLLSYVLIMLSFWICFLMILSSESLYNKNYYWEMFLMLVILLMISLYLTFCSLNMFIFYLFFEASMVPVLLLILGWGIQPERIFAGMYLLFYTLFMSLPMMIGLFYLYKNFYSLEFYFLGSLNNMYMYMCLNMVFFVKMPMFFMHLWLPKAHVEAPISGSMILAGVMLKLGGYGFLRVMKMFIQIGMKINIIFIVISLVGGMIVSLMCIRQSDMKMLIAYSSVSHMALVLSGILTLNLWGFWGSLVLMLAHGFCSSGLFCLANLLYERTHSRSIYLNKGFINIFPSLSFWWFLMCSSNMASPPSLNLMGEVMLINSIMSYSNYSLICLFFMAFYSAVYSLFLYSYTQHGKFYSGLFSLSQINIREYLLLFLHWFPLNILFMKSEYLIYWI